SGGTTISDGTLSISSDVNLGNASGTVIFKGGTLRIDDYGPLFTPPTRQFLTDGANAIFETPPGFFLDISGGISGDAGLVKNGPGTLVLRTTASTYAGPTTINAGTLQRRQDELLPDGTDLTVNGVFEFQLGVTETVGSLSGSGSVRFFTTTGNHLRVGANNTSTTFGGIISANGGDGQLTKIGTGTLTLTGDSTYSGGTTISGGTLVLGHSNAAGTGPITITGSTLGYANGVNIANAIVLENDATLNV
ncbi:unnamed protein product, partial [marine sediment metagenome]